MNKTHPATARFLFGLLLFTSAVFAQSQSTKKAGWEEKLFEKNVTYQTFACEPEYEDSIVRYFLEQPLNPRIFVCHNNCAVIESYPKLEYPAAAAAFKTQGLVKIHVLVNEDGRAIYARVLDGHPFFGASAFKGACETKFKRSADMRQNVLSFCYGECNVLRDQDDYRKLIY